MRGQTTLPAVGVALVLLTGIATIGVIAGNTAFEGANREPVHRQAAVGLSERLVDEIEPLAISPNVLDADAVSRISDNFLRKHYGVPGDLEVTLRLNDKTIYERGDPAGGVSFERIVLVAEETTWTRTPADPAGHAVTLPRRSDRATMTIHTGPDGSIRAVLADGQVVLQNESGLAGTFEIDVSEYETTPLRFEAVGDVQQGAVIVETHPIRTRKAVLEVQVDD